MAIEPPVKLYGDRDQHPKDVDTMSLILDAFLDGATGAGLFGKLRWPGASTELIDSRSVEEFLASGEFEETLSKLGYQPNAMIIEKQRSK